MDSASRVKQVIIIAAIVAALAVSGLAAAFIVKIVTDDGRGSLAPQKNTKQSGLVENDTAQAFRLLMDTVLTRNGLPDQDKLNRNNPFGDSVIFCNEGWDLDWSVYFPGKVKLKFLSRSEICALAARSSGQAPNFVELAGFEKKDSIYEITLRSNCVSGPGEDKMKRAAGKGVPLAKDSCSFGILCGGILSMSFEKKNDSLHTKTMRVLLH